MTFPGIPPTAPFDGVGGKALHTGRPKVLDSKHVTHVTGGVYIAVGKSVLESDARDMEYRGPGGRLRLFYGCFFGRGSCPDMRKMLSKKNKKLQE